MTGHVVQDGSFLLTKIAVSEHGNDRGVLECVGGRFVLGWWRLVSAPALRLGSGTGWWWDCIFFVVDDE